MKDWRDDAACRGMDTRLFFPERDGKAAKVAAAAKAVCAGCPVKAECLAYCLAMPGYDGRFGIWGGTGEKQRRGMVKPRPTSVRCGTVSGYSTHRHRGEATCEACKAAYRIYRAAERAGAA